MQHLKKAHSVNFQSRFYFIFKYQVGNSQIIINLTPKHHLDLASHPQAQVPFWPLPGSRIPEVRSPSELTNFQYQLQNSTDSLSALQALPFASLVIYSQWFY